jgi:hypothetical protein
VLLKTSSKWVSMFTLVKKLLRESQKKKTVVDGAISNLSAILKFLKSKYFCDIFA